MLADTELEQITTEIMGYKRQISQNILKIGREELGTKATINQICNYVGPQFGITGQECLQFFFTIKGGGQSE